ncbi:MAG: hypothetical protein ACO3JL_10245 [Myxococcota bacterium]
MGLEILVCAFLASFFLGGFLTPVGLWLAVTTLQRRRLVSGLERAGGFLVESAGGEDAEVPARLRICAGGSSAVVAAASRQGCALWEVRFPCAAPSPRFVLVREGALHTMPRPSQEAPALTTPGLPPGFHLHVSGAATGNPLAEVQWSAFARSSHGGVRLLGCACTGEELVLAWERRDLAPGSLLRVLRQSVRVLDSLGLSRAAGEPAGLGRAHARVTAASSGAPVVLPA